MKIGFQVIGFRGYFVSASLTSSITIPTLPFKDLNMAALKNIFIRAKYIPV